jgi:hypothetical protein
MELIGEGITNKLTPLIRAINEWAAAMGGPEGIMKRLTEEGKKMQEWIYPLAGAIMGALVPALWAAAAGMWATFAPLLPFVAAGAALGLAIKYVHDNFAMFQPLIERVENFIRNNLMPAIMFLKNYFVLLWQTFVELIMPQLQELWANIQPFMPLLIEFAKIVGIVLVAAFVGLVTGIAAAVVGIVTALNIVIRWFKDMYLKAQENVNFIVRLFVDFPGAISDALKGLFEAMTKPFKEAFDWISGAADKVWEKLQRINPFHRESPSLVDNVTSGTAEIASQYQDMASKLSAPLMDVGLNMEAAKAMSLTQNMTFNVSDKLDLQSVMAEVDRHLSAKAIQANFGIS